MGMIGSLPMDRCRIARSVSGSWPDDGRVGDAAVGELHPDRVGAGDDVLVGDDGALRVDDHARAQAALDALAIARPVIAEQLIERRGLPPLGDHARGIDIDHRRRRARHRVGEALHDHGRRGGRSDGGCAPRPACGAAVLTAPSRAGFHQTTRKAAARPTTTALSKKLTRTRAFCNPTPQAALRWLAYLCIMRPQYSLGNTMATGVCVKFCQQFAAQRLTRTKVAKSTTNSVRQTNERRSG